VLRSWWRNFVGNLDRRALDRFTRDFWKRSDHRDVEPLKWAILRRRRVLARQPRQTRAGAAASLTITLSER
jgi:hypothetical protein